MKVFYWIRYHLGKVLLILIIVWALITGLKFFFPGSSSSKASKNRPSSIDFRPIKEGKPSNYNRRPRQHLEEIKPKKTPFKTMTYTDTSRNGNQFTISDETQSMLVEMRKELNDYGILMEDLLLAVEIYYQKNKKSKKGPTKNELMALLPDHIKELVPENKRKFKEAEDDKNKKDVKEPKTNLTSENGQPPSEIITPDGQDIKIDKETLDQEPSEQVNRKKSNNSLSEEQDETHEAASPTPNNKKNEEDPAFEPSNSPSESTEEY